MGINHPPYHLRTNKAVDRLLLAYILLALEMNKKENTYYSLAGPFLEDLRIIDHFLPEMRLISIERDTHTFARQNFHKFNSRLIIKKNNFRDFLINDYEPGEIDAFWLDYTNLKYGYFEVFQLLLNKVPPGSVIRITLRAQPEIDLLQFNNRLSEEQLQEIQLEFERKFQDEFYKVLSIPTAGAFASKKEFAKIVQHMVMNAASGALDTAGSDIDFIPIQSTCYDDNTQMLSITGIVCLRNKIDDTREKLKSIHCRHYSWEEDPSVINIPHLSLKERLFIEHILPIVGDQNAGEELYNLLNYNIGRSKSDSLEQLTRYAEYYRDYPNFIRIIM